MSRKYGEAMDRVQVTPEMRLRILSNIQGTDLSTGAGKKIIRFLSLRRLATLAACLAVVLVGALTVPHLMNSERQTYPLGVLLPNGFTQVSSLDQLSQSVGFSVEELTGLPFAVEETEYVYMEDMAEVRYRGQGQEAVYRKAPGSEDISGDYNAYENENSIEMDGSTVTLKGNSNGYTLAVWADGEYAHSLSFSLDMSMDELLSVLPK